MNQNGEQRATRTEKIKGAERRNDKKENTTHKIAKIVNERMNEYNEKDIYRVGGSFADLKFQIS